MIILGFNILILAWANCVVAAGHYLYNKCSFYRTKWVSSYSPYQISISLNQIQEFLNMDKHMSHDLFNMGVRILATIEHQKLKSSKQKVTKHYMDL
jgi:phosphoribosylaminoimidazole (AIR) synthetase